MRERLEPSRDMREFQSWDSNCRPRPVTMVESTPKREIQPARKAWATDSAVMPACESINTRQKVCESS